jgi:tetratricopeptide (TPR) repeat protein
LEPFTPLPHPFNISFFFITWLLIGLPLQVIAQDHKPSKKEIRIARIDSIYTMAERNELNTKEVLRYEFYFDDPQEKRLCDFASRMFQDSFEIASLAEKKNRWSLILFKNIRLSREAMYDLESKLRGLKYSYYLDHYLGFTIHPADPDPVAVSDKEFPEYLHSLSDEDLFWVGKRLLEVKDYKRARIALELGVHRQYKPDTTTYHYGLALVATQDPDDGIGQLKRSVKLNPNYLEAYLALGKIHYENAYFDKALEYFKKADALSPGHSDILLKISETLYGLELYNQSYSYAKRAHELDKKNVFIKSLLGLLKEPRVKYLRKKYPEK